LVRVHFSFGARVSVLPLVLQAFGEPRSMHPRADGIDYIWWPPGGELTVSEIPESSNAVGHGTSTRSVSYALRTQASVHCLRPKGVIGERADCE
jgi:hypothetical protein